MKLPRILLGVLGIMLMCSFSLCVANGQSSNPQETLNQCITALQRNPSDQVLREKIIRLALEMNPPPDIPETAKALAVEAVAKAKIASGPSDYAEVIETFEKAIQMAPWNADYYYDVGRLQEKAGKPENAIANFKLYLLAAPNASDTQKVADMIADLEAQIKAAKEAALAQTRLLRFLNREWSSENPIAENGHEEGRAGFKLTVQISDDGITKITLADVSTKQTEPYRFEGTLDGNTVRARFVGPRTQSSDGGTITLKKAGGLLKAKIDFTVGGASFSYNDFLD
jgi:tetratricopeptide (TPR) repeat protein